MWRFIRLQKKKARKGLPSGPRVSAELLNRADLHQLRVNAAALRPEASPAGQHEHAR